MRVRLAEIFTSIEGEGAMCGTKTLFVRLAGCPFSCSYCDTAEYIPARSGEELDTSEVKGMIGRALEPRTYKVNFTGGDPLAQHEAVAELAAHARSLGVPTYLESSCFDEARFRAVLPHMDMVKVELKTADSGFVPEGRHPDLLRSALGCLRAAAAAGKEAHVKIVVGSGTDPAHVGELARRAAEAAPPEAVSGLFLQPVHGPAAPGLRLLMEMHDAAAEHYPGVRVVPQLHKAIGAP